MILGCDVSHYQNSGEIPENAGFVWIKATEGSNYKDVRMNDHLTHIAQKRKDNLPIIGFYHYAHLESNEADVEVNNFLGRIKPHIGQCLMAVDVEGKCMEKGSVFISRWINTFAGLVYEETGVIPFLYMSDSNIKSIISGLRADIPIWNARYSTKSSPSNYGKYPLMWQFTCNPIDLDLWYGSKDELARLALKR